MRKARFVLVIKKQKRRERNLQFVFFLSLFLYKTYQKKSKKLLCINKNEKFGVQKIILFSYDKRSSH